MKKDFSLDNGSYKISCRQFTPEGPVDRVIIGVHGFCGSKESTALYRLAELMDGEGCALICFDLPAHGASTAEDSCLTLANCRRDLLFMLDYAASEFPGASGALFSTSFGGYTTLLCLPDIPPELPIVLRAPAVNMAATYLTDLLGLSEAEYMEKGVIRCGFDRKVSIPFSFYKELKANSAMAGDLGRRMLVIYGTADDLIRAEDTQRFLELNPMAVPFPIDGADHRFTRPDDLSAALERARLWFLEEWARA